MWWAFRKTIRRKAYGSRFRSFRRWDTNITASVSGGTLVIDWPHLAARNLLAGGQIALYATSDTTAAQAEIAQMYTDNGKLDPYYDWIDGFPIAGTDADLFADPDGDGLNNLAEYALGGNPTNGADIGYLPTSGMYNDGGVTNWFEVVHARRKGSSGELNYVLESTSNLLSNDWNTATYVELPATGNLDADFESVTNRIDTTGKTNEFVRLKIDAL